MSPALIPSAALTTTRAQAPAHRNELPFAVSAYDCINSCCWADVVTRLRISRRLVQRESVQRDDFFPCQLIGGAPAHDRI